MEHPKRWTMDEPGYGRAPVVTADSAGRYWVAWISWIDEGECIRVCRTGENEKWIEPFICGQIRPFITGLSITAYGKCVLVAWIDGPDETSDGLKIAWVTDEGLKEIRLL